MTERDDPIYREFDDVDFKDWPYVTSAKARAEIGVLMALHGLAFWHNPGGGEFVGDNFRCQVLLGDDVEDLNRLRAALAERGAS